MKDKWIKAPQSIIDFLYKRAYKCRIEVVILYIILSIVISGVSVCVIFNFIATINNSDIDVLELIKRILFSVAIISLSIWITKTCIKFKAKCWEKELIVLKDSEINSLQYKLDKIF